MVMAAFAKSTRPNSLFHTSDARPIRGDSMQGQEQILYRTEDRVYVWGSGV